MSASKITVNKLELKPGTWRMKVNVMTYDAAGKRIDRAESYSTFKGTEAQAETERYRLLLGAGVQEKAVLMMDPAAGLSAAVAASDMTVGEYAERWLERRLFQAMEGQTSRFYKGIHRLYVLPAWGHLKLATVHRDQIIDGFATLVKGGPRQVGNDGRDKSGRSGKPLAPRTIDGALAQLKSVLTDAAEAGLCNLKACDFKRVKAALPKVGSQRNRARAKALSDQQTDRLLALVEHHQLGPKIRFALASGCRRGEICALKWGGVFIHEDRDTAIVTITQSLADDGQQIWLKGTKTEGSVRSITLTGSVVVELRAARARAEEAAEVLGLDVEGMPVFPNTRGAWMNPGDLSEQVRQMMQRAGLEGFSLHSCRHTHASTLLRMGYNIAMISKRLGHSDPGFTLRVYSWAMPSEDIKLAEAMAQAMGDKPRSAPEPDKDEMEDEDTADGDIEELEAA
jgi:integrase